jgi:oligopeptide transport system substrate-binding protein
MKKYFNILGLLVIASVLLGACGGGGAVQTVVVTEIVEGEVVEKVVTATPEAMEAGLVTVYYNWGTEPPTGDPQLGTDTTSSNVTGSIFTGLTDIDDETKAAVPSLATSWEPNEDATEWTFTLRDDVPWVQYDAATGEINVVTDDEGNPRMTTAQDVVYGVKRACDPTVGSNYAYIMFPIVGCEALNSADPESEDFQALYDAVGVEALDDFTVKFTLNFGAGFWPQVTTMATTYPVYKPVVEEMKDRWVEPGFIVTNGAYVMEEWVHGDHLNLLKNPNWPMWGTDYAPGNIERLVGYTIEEDSTSFALYENNELDTSELPLDQIDRVKADPVLGEEYVQVPSNCTYYYGFIMERPAVSDVKVRQALSMGIDRPTLVDQVTKGGQIPANTFTNPLNFGNAAEDPDIAPWALTEEKGGTGYAAAVEMGKGLLEEAGYPNGDGLDILLMHNVSEGHARIAQAIQAFWQEAYPGMNVTVETQEWGVYLNTIEATTDVSQVPDVYRLGWCADYPHANNWLHEVFNPDQGSNRTRMSEDDPQIGDLVKEYSETTQAAQTASEEEAKGLYKRAEKLLVEEMAAIAPIYYYTTVRVTKPWLDRTYDEIKLHLFQWELDQAAQMGAMQ